MLVQNSSSAEPNRWYLAYGSNLSSDTFRGRRGIRPLAQANVLVPSLELTFDLPGIPYWEPCFANVRRRKETSPTGQSGGIMYPSRNSKACEGLAGSSQPVLIGVAYLVTAADYARIIATEGGGAAYEEVVVECQRLPGSEKKAGDTAGYFAADASIPAQNGQPESETIQAATLLAPDSKRRLEPMQPSKRYIDIIRAGARENDMPASYIAYLDAIPFYHTTGLRQRLGASLFLAMWLPIVLFSLLLNTLFADRETGRVPKWVGVLTEAGRSAMWRNYGTVWKKAFGSGEVTDGTSGDLENRGKRQVNKGIPRQSLARKLVPIIDQ